LSAVVLSVDGMVAIRRSGSAGVDAAAQLGRALAAQMLGEGAGSLLGEPVS
jgi:hydroxymethylbilane synthase